MAFHLGSAQYDERNRLIGRTATGSRSSEMPGGRAGLARPRFVPPHRRSRLPSIHRRRSRAVARVRVPSRRRGGPMRRLFLLGDARAAGGGVGREIIVAFWGRASPVSLRRSSGRSVIFQSSRRGGVDLWGGCFSSVTLEPRVAGSSARSLSRSGVSLRRNSGRSVICQSSWVSRSTASTSRKRWRRWGAAMSSGRSKLGVSGVGEQGLAAEYCLAPEGRRGVLLGVGRLS